MKSPEEIACEIVDDFWDKGTACTHEYCVEMITKAIKEAQARERNKVLLFLAREIEAVAEKVKANFGDGHS